MYSLHVQIKVPVSLSQMVVQGLASGGRGFSGNPYFIETLIFSTYIHNERGRGNETKVCILGIIIGAWY